MGEKANNLAYFLKECYVSNTKKITYVIGYHFYPIKPTYQTTHSETGRAVLFKFTGIQLPLIQFKYWLYIYLLVAFF